MKTTYKDTLNLYKSIDQTIEVHFNHRRIQAPCTKGCASCCSQFFEISQLEFTLIAEHISGLPTETQNLFRERATVLLASFQEHWPTFYHSFFTAMTIDLHTEDYYSHEDRFKVVMPCVFLSDEGACQIYERRPIVCRTTGVGYQHLINQGAVCNVIRHGVLTPLWQANLRPYHHAINAIRWLADDSNALGVKRQYPMFYFAYDLLVNKNKYKYDKLLISYQKIVIREDKMPNPT